MRVFKIRYWYNEEEFSVSDVTAKTFGNACLAIEKSQNKLFRYIVKFELL